MPAYGFTLIELLLSIAIIGTLASIMLPNLLTAQKRSYDTGARMCAKSLQTAQAISMVDYKTYVNLSSNATLLSDFLLNLDKSCRNPNIFVKDRAASATLASTYTFDVWDIRGSAVITATPTLVSANVPGSTPFSNTGAGGINFP
ncbi:type II secretion system protein [Deinococcus multiflagellatus]|uniref:Type II secretion system protein n=2 Tax=Deinococcus multiflagellatus TaxID=1656887 RepID=A0ABW1ZNI3_9DEIO